MAEEEVLKMPEEELAKLSEDEQEGVRKLRKYLKLKEEEEEKLQHQYMEATKDIPPQVLDVLQDSLIFEVLAIFSFTSVHKSLCVCVCVAAYGALDSCALRRRSTDRSMSSAAWHSSVSLTWRSTSSYSWTATVARSLLSVASALPKRT